LITINEIISIPRLRTS